MTVSVVIAAGGKGTRMGAGFNKVFMKLADEEVILHTMRAFEANKDVDEIIVVIGEDDKERVTNIAEVAHITKLSAVTAGGESRCRSVYNGIQLAKGDFIAIHDGARALIGQADISAVISDAKKYGAAAVGVQCKDTLKSADENGFIIGTIDRSKTYQIQTPQVFEKELILDAHKRAREENFEPTDDCALIEYYGGKIKITQGSYDNIKLTTPEDMFIGEEILKKVN